jgi:hypothetical protein
MELTAFSEEIEHDMERIWMRQAEQRFTKIESGKMSCCLLEAAVNEIRGRLTRGVGAKG